MGTSNYLSLNYQSFTVPWTSGCCPDLGSLQYLLSWRWNRHHAKGSELFHYNKLLKEQYNRSQETVFKTYILAPKDMCLVARKPDFVACNNNGAVQPAHQRSLISTFVICYLQNLIYKLASYKISTFKLVSAAEQADRKLLRQVFWLRPIYNL